MFFVFLPGGISKEWRHIVSANCDFDRELSPCLCNVYGPFGQDLGDRKNYVRRMWGHAGAIFILLAELGLQKPPSGNPEGLVWQGQGKVAPSRFRCGQAIVVNRGKRDIHGSRDIHGLQLVYNIIVTMWYWWLYSLTHALVHKIVCASFYVNTYAYLYTDRQTDRHTYIYIHTYIHTHIHTYIHTYMHTYTHMHDIYLRTQSADIRT